MIFGIRSVTQKQDNTWIEEKRDFSSASEIEAKLQHHQRGLL